ncbi:MAG: hypothetical protein HKL80_01360 [Acidimicrobiales bacterium]|nr:hypothetical protein [Acidimicrobiales bacterium]
MLPHLKIISNLGNINSLRSGRGTHLYEESSTSTSSAGTLERVKTTRPIETVINSPNFFPVLAWMLAGVLYFLLIRIYERKYGSQYIPEISWVSSCAHAGIFKPVCKLVPPNSLVFLTWILNLFVPTFFGAGIFLSGYYLKTSKMNKLGYPNYRAKVSEVTSLAIRSIIYSFILIAGAIFVWHSFNFDQTFSSPFVIGGPVFGSVLPFVDVIAAVSVAAFFSKVISSESKCHFVTGLVSISIYFATPFFMLQIVKVDNISPYLWSLQFHSFEWSESYLLLAIATALSIATYIISRIQKQVG